MKLFVSYARVDRPYCIQIVETLDTHDLWYDQRLEAGKNWWKEILRRLDWCDGFIYLLSPDSVKSTYCQKEFALARDIGRYIFPVLIEPGTEIPEELKELQYVDFTKGLTAEAVASLLTSIHKADVEKPLATKSKDKIKPGTVQAPSVNPATVIHSATKAMSESQFDQAVFLLKQAQAAGYESRFINIDAVLAEAEAGLQRQSYLREADREYRQILALVELDRTHKLGCEAFQAFHIQYPDHDPQNLAERCQSTPATTISVIADTQTVTRNPEIKLPLLEWCPIPGGKIESPVRTEDNKVASQMVEVAAFRITKYPITNAQYRVFLDDETGYADSKWWSFSEEAKAWRERTPNPRASSFKGDERPREMVNWYDAMAFCQWLSTRIGQKVALPTDAQWVRAAQGDDKRTFPWGTDFEQGRCNTRESDIKMTTLVMRYDNGVSPYGVYDMSGNTWEWCIDADGSKRLVHGGSFISPHQRAEVEFRYYLPVISYHSTIGFRVITTA